jgi:hypothetical protein
MIIESERAEPDNDHAYDYIGPLAQLNDQVPAQFYAFLAMCYSVMAPEKRLLAWSSMSLCVVIDQPVGNPKRKV